MHYFQNKFFSLNFLKMSLSLLVNISYKGNDMKCPTKLKSGVVLEKKIVYIFNT